MARNVDALYIFLLIVCGMMTLLIFVCLVYFLRVSCHTHIVRFSFHSE